jgi:hypothetical protein
MNQTIEGLLINLRETNYPWERAWNATLAADEGGPLPEAAGSPDGFDDDTRWTCLATAVLVRNGLLGGSEGLEGVPDHWLLDEIDLDDDGDELEEFRRLNDRHNADLAIHYRQKWERRMRSLPRLAPGEMVETKTDFRSPLWTEEDRLDPNFWADARFEVEEDGGEVTVTAATSEVAWVLANEDDDAMERFLERFVVGRPMRLRESRAWCGTRIDVPPKQGDDYGSWRSTWTCALLDLGDSSGNGS